MESKLYLQIIEDGNCDTITIKDISVYNADITVSEEELVIGVPGFGDCFVFNPSHDFLETYNSHDFKLTDQDCTDIVGLPDGIYYIKYSICPHDKIYVEYNHLRQCQAISMYYSKLCALQLEPCAILPSEKEKYVKELMDIKFYLEAAKAYVESCSSPKKGLELHNYAVDRLSKIKIDCLNCK